MHNASDVMDLLKWALGVGFIAGIVALFLGGILSGFAATSQGQLIISFALLVALVFLAKHAKIDNVSVFELVLLFAAITAFGSLIGMFVPQVSSFILTIGDNLTVSGLLFTFFYIAVAEVVLNKLNVKL